jgi:hypothetical protein
MLLLLLATVTATWVLVVGVVVALCVTAARQDRAMASAVSAARSRPPLQLIA